MSADIVGGSAQQAMESLAGRRSSVPAHPWGGSGVSAEEVAADSQQWLRVAPRRSLQPELKLSLIMAAFNEEQTVLDAIGEVLSVQYPCEIELIVLDDGSTDSTPDLLARIDDSRVKVIRHSTNHGKGAALKTGAEASTGSHILPFDADLEYAPEDILKLIEPVLRGRCSVVYGVRLFGCNTVYRSYLYAAGNKIFTRFANILFGACLSDLHTCLKLIPTDIWRSLDLGETGFGLDTEVSASLLRSGIRPFEVPVSYFSRSHAEGKKIKWHDALACMWILLRVRAQPRSRFKRARELSAMRIERENARRGTSGAIGPQLPPLKLAEQSQVSCSLVEQE